MSRISFIYAKEGYTQTKFYSYCQLRLMYHRVLQRIKTLTLIVGTNALNVTDNIPPIPLLEVIKDYEKLIYELRSLFRNARIGLFNIIPRVYSCRETYHRIDVFNSLLSGHVANIIPNVYWIRLYWEFVDKSGYLRHEFYGRNGAHLNFMGKGLMVRTISNFQMSYF